MEQHRDPVNNPPFLRLFQAKYCTDLILVKTKNKKIKRSKLGRGFAIYSWPEFITHADDTAKIGCFLPLKSFTYRSNYVYLIFPIKRNNGSQNY